MSKPEEDTATDAAATVQAEPVPVDEQPRAPGVKAAMREWRAQHPQEAAERAEQRRRDGKNRQVRKMLSELIPETTIEKANQRLAEMLDATMPVAVNLPGSVEEGKPVPGGQEVQFVPDNKARLEAIKVVAAYTEGLPVARQINVQADFRTLDDERRLALLGSSAVQEALAEFAEE